MATADASAWPLAAPRPRAVRGVPELAAMARRRRRPDAMRAYQLERVQALLAHAARRAPVYDGVVTEAMADAVRSLDDLAQFPVVDKRWLVDRGSEGWTPPPGAPVHVSTTSGTTGQIFPVPWSAWARWRGWVQRVWMMREMRAPFVGRRLAVGSRAIRERDDTRPGLRAMEARKHSLPDTVLPDEVAADILRWRPAWITGHPHELAAAAEVVAGRYRPRLVTTHGVSSDDRMRHEIEAGLGRRPLDIYGAAEVLQIAWQCRKGDLYHVNHDLVVVELLDDDHRPVPAGEVGHVVLTGLLNSVLPIIRYRVGDSAVYSPRPCACGEPLPAFERVEGRTFDWLVDDQGTRVAPQRLWISVVMDDGWDVISKYRVRQDADRRVTIDVVPLPGFDEALAAKIVAAYAVPLGPSTPIEVRTVDAIELLPGHRFRQFMSAATPFSQ